MRRPNVARVGRRRLGGSWRRLRLRTREQKGRAGYAPAAECEGEKWKAAGMKGGAGAGWSGALAYKAVAEEGR